MWFYVDVEIDFKINILYVYVLVMNYDWYFCLLGFFLMVVIGFLLLGKGSVVVGVDYGGCYYVVL